MRLSGTGTHGISTITLFLSVRIPRKQLLCLPTAQHLDLQWVGQPARGLWILAEVLTGEEAAQVVACGIRPRAVSGGAYSKASSCHHGPTTCFLSALFCPWGT